MNSEHLLGIWRDSATDIITLCEPLTASQWNAPTPCPGWSVADVVAHLIDMEALLAQDPRPDIVIDWSTLPHVQSDLGRIIEVGVQLRRREAKSDILAEYAEILDRRAADLANVTGPVLSPFGQEVALETLLGMRIFDSWVHEQDIRLAIDQPGGMETPAASIAANRMVLGLPKAWGKSVAPPPGSTLRVTITGPGFETDTAVIIDDDGRAQTIPADTSDPTVHLRMSWPDYMLAATGRIDTTDPQWRERIQFDGDPELVTTVLRSINVAP
jgi:uncharacterized protein (TIGR03083 family)